MKRISVGIFAHVDAGKTTLSEGLLFYAGEIRSMGRVDTKNTFLDTDEIERKRGITVFSKQAILNLEDTVITLLDTPGHVDFSAEAERTVGILDYAILIISATDGISGHTKTLFKILENNNIPTFVFINKTDLDGADKSAVIISLREEFNGNFVDFCDKDKENMYENIALSDEKMMDEYLETSKVGNKMISEAIKRRKLFPCFSGSALKNEGVKEFLDEFRALTSGCEYPERFGAKVYKISQDDKGQRLTFLKVTGGRLKVKDVLETEPGYNEKINEIRIYSGEKYKSSDEAEAGTVCAVTGLKKTYAGQGFGFEKNAPGLTAEPIFTYRVIFPSGTDEVTALSMLKELEQEETKLNVTFEKQHKEIQIRLMGEVQLEVLKQLISNRFGIDVQFEEGRIVYKETLAERVEGVGHFEPLKHYAEVHLLLEPLERGSGMKFETDVSEDELDKNWQRLILTHLMEKTHIGVLTGSPITDIKITLKKGRAHEKHTEGGDFRQATYRAIRHGLRCGKSILLEPCYNFTLEIPTENTGRAMTDLDRMGAEFEMPRTRGNATVISGNVSAEAIRNYNREVIGYTHGKGKLNCVFCGYCECKNADEVIEKYGYNPDADVENTADSVFCAGGAGFNVKWDEVTTYMHLESVLKPVKEEEAEKTVKQVSKNIHASDEELLKIFEKTYGKVERKNPNHTLRTPKSELKDTKIKERKYDKEYLLIDGYNIIFAWDELKELSKISLESARDRLIERLSVYKLFKNYEIILVFDAYKVKGNRGEIEEKDGITVVYTKESQTADNYIEKTAKELTKNYRVTVATSDALEQMIIFGSGAYRFSARIFEEDVLSVEKKIENMVEKNNLKGDSAKGSELRAFLTEQLKKREDI